MPGAGADDVAETVNRLLAEPGYAQAARTAQRHMLALPPVTAAVDHLVGIAGH